MCNKKMKNILIYTLQSEIRRARGRKEQLEFIRKSTIALISFLQNNNLVTRNLLENDSDLTDDFKLMKSDLTDIGYLVLQKTLTKWLDTTSNGNHEPDDITILEKKLMKVSNT